MSYHKVYLDNIDTLTKKYPSVFNKVSPLPLVEGVHLILRADKELGWSNRKIKMVLACWTSRKEYQRAMLQIGYRYNLDSTTAGKINAEHLAHARIMYSKCIRVENLKAGTYHFA